MCSWDCLAVLAAIFLPPLGVFMKKACACEFWICILLTILGIVPGSIYAIYVVVKNIHGDEGNVVYYQNS